MFNKRGVSPIIATVLLLVLTFVIISIIAVFIIPFVQESFGKSEGCFDVLGSLSFDATPYSCFAEQNGQARTGFSVRINGEDIAGFRVSLFQQGSSNTQEIIQGTQLLNIRLLDKDFNTALEVPKSGGVRTYVANGTYEKIEVNAVLLNGEVCQVSDDLIPKRCIDPDGTIKQELFYK